MSLHDQIAAVKRAVPTLLDLKDAERGEVLLAVAEAIEAQQDPLLDANRRDLERMSRDDPRYDRLELNPQRLSDIADEMRRVAALPSPLNLSLESRTLPNGLQLERLSVPIGVVGVIYEARPNVTFDVFGLCFKSGNGTVLKGGSDAADSNQAIVSLLHTVLTAHSLSTDLVQLLPPTREAVGEMLSATDSLDVVIPRGSKALIDHVREHSKVPVIETGAGVVHTYLDSSVDLEMAKGVITNAKTRRVSVCNALDTLVVHSDHLSDLPALLAPLAEHNVEIFADEATYQALEGSYPHLKQAAPGHFGQEFLSYKMAVRAVSTLDEALDHIAEHSSRHSEAILSSDPASIERFLDRVDAAVVYANASTAFTDGAQFGLGAEIGISTQKLPPRGPMGLRDLTSYKWRVRGTGQVRP